jgi:hypothetical protein
LLATLARPRRTGTAGIAELAEDLAELVVDRLQYGRVLVERRLAQGGQPGDGLVNARVPGGRGWGPEWFGVHEVDCALGLLASA